MTQHPDAHSNRGVATPRVNMSVTLHTTLGDIKLEVFCESVPKTAEARPPKPFYEPPPSPSHTR